MVANVIQYGAGLMGQRCMQLMVRKGFNIIAVIDIKEDLLGKDIGELIGLDMDLGIKVTDDIPSVLKGTKKADVLALATVTSLEQQYKQMKPFIEAGLNVVSLSEELSYPWFPFPKKRPDLANWPKLGKEIDKLAKAHNVSVLGTGVNPGFIMEYIPLCFASGCWNIEKIKIERVVDLSPFSLTRNVYRFGRPPSEFRRIVREGKISVLHHGLMSTVTMIADALGWKLDDITETWEWMISKSVRTYKGQTIEPGRICGIRQTGLGSTGGEARVIAIFNAFIHPNLEEDGVEEGDTVWIYGEPSITIRTTGGTSHDADLVTTARLVNSIPAVIDAKPGLIFVKDLPPVPPLPDKEIIYSNRKY